MSLKSRIGTRRTLVGVWGSASTMVLALAAAGLAPQTAQAQARPATQAAAGATVDIEELVVTARKREERLRDIPVTATALGIGDINDLGGVPTAQALLSNVPGVNFANTSNPVTSDVSLRGSGTSRATNAEAGVGLFRDGAYIGGGTVGGRTFTDMDLFDPQRIEVLRGVQGGLNGRNAEGGSINVISARPEHNWDGYAQATVGVHDMKEAQLAFNIPLGEHLAGRLSIDDMEQTKGFYHLYVIDQYADAQFKHFYRGQLAFDYGRFKANFLAENAQERLPGLIYQVVTFPGANWPKGVFTDKYQTPWNSPSMGKQRMANFELTTSTDLDWATLSTVTMSRDRRGENAYDRDALSIDFIKQAIAGGKASAAATPALLAADYGQGGDQLDKARIFYQDAHLAGAGTGALKPLTWVAGTEYYILHDSPTNVLGKSSTAASPSPGTIDRGNQRFESWAVYGEAVYDITDKLNVSADLRYTDDKQEFHTHRFDFGTGAPGAAAFGVDGSRSASNTSYTVTVGYKPIANTLVYAKIGTAYRAGGFNGSLGDPRQPITPPTSFDNETVTAYELGFKGNITSDIYVTLAAYENDYDNLVIQGDNGCFAGNPVCPVQATSFAFNAGPAKLNGVEAELTWRTELLGGALRATVGGSEQGGKITGGIYNGRHQPQQPKSTQTYNVNYRHDLVEGVTAFANLNGNARQGGVQEVAQTPPLHDYTMLNGRIGVDWNRYELSLWANNMANTNYIVFEATSATNAVRRYNLPQTYGATLRYTW
jgi:iron complex outermembrane receptor protein